MEMNTAMATARSTCMVRMYGPSAEALFRAIEPVLKNYPAHAGSYVSKRYGKPGSKQDRIPVG